MHCILNGKIVKNSHVKPPSSCKCNDTLIMAPIKKIQRIGVLTIDVTFYTGTLVGPIKTS